MTLKPQVNHTGWMTAVAPADRPKSVRNSCVIGRICSVFVSFHLCIVCRLGLFSIWLRQISSLSFSYHESHLYTYMYTVYGFKHILIYIKQKQKYRGMFETQKSRNKTSSGDIGLNIRTLASPKVGQDQVSGGVSVLCWHAAPVANVLWKPLAIR